MGRGGIALAIVGTLASGCESAGPTDLGGEPTVWAVRLPPPALDPPPADGDGLQTAVLAGGCFWGVEAVFQHVKGVEAVTSGYSGGTAATANYAAVLSGTTGHAEAVQIRFDPATISFGQVLQVFMSVAHDPTQLDAQYPDFGPQYRSHVFYASEGQRDVVRAYIAQLGTSGLLAKPIATRLDPITSFHPAEDEHLDYVARHPSDPYVIRFDLPKLDGLKSLFPDLYREPGPLATALP